MHTFKQCDYYNVIRTAEEEARERGHAIGLAEGRAEGRAEGLTEGLAEGLAEGKKEMALSIAKKLLVEGMTVQKISELTGLDIDEFQTE